MLSCGPHLAGTPVADGPLPSDLQRHRADHRPEEDELPGTEHRVTANYHHRRLRIRRRSSVYVPRLHHHRQLGHRDRQNDRKSSYNSRPPHDSCVNKPQADSKNKDGSSQRLCHHHTAVRQRDMDYVCHTGDETSILGISAQEAQTALADWVMSTA